MALKKCKDCGKEVSSSAKLCPYCGRKYPTGGWTTGVKIVLSLVVMSALGQMIRERNDLNVPQNENHSQISTPAVIVAKYSAAQIESGRALHSKILSKHPDVDQFYHKAYLFGALTDHPLSVISIPTADWLALSKAERESLEAYAASRVNAVRSSPFDYIKIPASAPVAPMIRKNVSAMTANSWGIMVGSISQDGHGIMSDDFAIKGE